ncbi:U-box domain-containing protein 33-like [Tripterygium wilfordii]|uniref:U-box domain-containing protein 33-like n=1 Tax=Tripterygium wilfordii TaxID=458696 RepID=UPI0018F83E73|nr:U-box domain-containing protein 33-like [Tripterygium wilfordii]
MAMAVVRRHSPAITQHVNPIRFREVGVPGIMATRGDIVEEPVARIIEDKIYVAVGKIVRECKSILLWALQNSGGKRICILHVHQPAQMIPLMGTKLPVSSLEEEKVKQWRQIERQEMHEVLDEYLLICRRMGIRAEKVYIERDCIEEGILQLISQHGIRNLVMGAAADKQYSRRMMDIKSKKAISVRLEAPTACHIRFICKGRLIYIREGISNGTTIAEVASSSLQASANPVTGQSDYLTSRSTVLERNDHHVHLANLSQDLFRRIRSLNFARQTERADDDIAQSLTPHNSLKTELSSDESDVAFRSASEASLVSSYSSSGLVNTDMFPLVTTEESEDGSMDDILYYQLEQARIEAHKSRMEALGEATRRAKAEKVVIDAIRRAKASESLYAEEAKQKKEIEEMLAKEKEKLERMKGERDKVMEELELSLNQKSLLENQISESDHITKELEREIFSAVELLQNFEKEREELQKERDTALKEVEELRKMPRFFSEFSVLEIKEATQNFDPSLKIGEGGYGSIYKGLLRHTQVAIKILGSHSKQGPSEFQQEVDVLSKIRHPNLVTLIGTCPETWTLIYEYLPNGSLEDRLSCSNNSPPLSWQTRIRIAAELCSVLIFLHSSKPHSIIHGDLKPANILLDANFMSKLSDFGICRSLSHDPSSSNETTQFCRTNVPKGTAGYIDPEFLTLGELTTKSDVYAFGIILLQLLTGRPALGITKEVQYALDAGNLKRILDPLAVDWPFVKAEQLARLAMRCCEMNRRSRPDLASDVWRVLEPMRASSGGTSLLQLGT